jgi:hypothetical protein
VFYNKMASVVDPQFDENGNPINDGSYDQQDGNPMTDALGNLATSAASMGMLGLGYLGAKGLKGLFKGGKKGAGGLAVSTAPGKTGLGAPKVPPKPANLRPGYVNPKLKPVTTSLRPVKKPKLPPSTLRRPLPPPRPKPSLGSRVQKGAAKAAKKVRKEVTKVGKRIAAAFKGPKAPHKRITSGYTKKTTKKPLTQKEVSKQLATEAKSAYNRMKGIKMSPADQKAALIAAAPPKINYKKGRVKPAASKTASTLSKYKAAASQKISDFTLKHKLRKPTKADITYGPRLW